MYIFSKYEREKKRTILHKRGCNLGAQLFTSIQIFQLI